MIRREEENLISYPPPPHPPPAGPSRPRGEEEEGISTQISGIISGYFTQVTVPSQVAVGQDINVSVSFYAINPGALYWKSFLILSSYQLVPNDRLLDATREIGQEGGRTKTYNLGPMPDSTVALSFFLFAHDDAGYDWDWSSYYYWLEYGYLPPSTYLGSYYAFISPISAPPTTETLEVDITPVGYGYVETSPASVEGTSTWYAGTTGRFPYGTSVQVTAYPITGYVFDHWSDEIVGGVSYSNPAYVKPMTEHRAVKAHFVAAVVSEEKLIISVTPIGKGTVTASPAPKRIVGNDWIYDYGTIVTVTAHPVSGYKFEKWSDEIEGGVSYLNPAQVKPMTEDRGVLAHFIKIEVPPGQYPCPYCDKVFATQEELNAHIKSAHPEEKPPGVTNWIPILIGGGVLVAAVALGSKKKPGEMKAKKK